MATRGAPQFQNRPSNVGGGNYGNSQRVVVDDDANSTAKWAIVGMIFFGIVCFMCLPISVFILMDAKKTNANSHEALAETKKLQAELKPKKDSDNE